MPALKTSSKQLCNWVMIAFIARSAFYAGFNFLLGKLDLFQLTPWLTSFVIFAPLLIACLLDRKILRKTILFFVFYAAVLLFFLVTLAIHPEYHPYYFRGNYLSVGYSIFSPATGSLWAVLVFILCDEPKRVFKNLRLGTYVLLLYCIYQVLTSTTFEAYNMSGKLIEQSYGLNFGYQAIFCSIVLFQYFFRGKGKWYDFAAALLAAAIAIIKGSRGSFLCLVTYVIIYILVMVNYMKPIKKITIISLIVVVSVTLSLTWTYILEWLLKVLSGVNTDSRLITMFLVGNLTSDSGRSMIYEITYEKLSEMGIWGYGAYGSRFALVSKVYWGYPHNIFLEFFLEFGWIIGILFSIIVVALPAFLLIRGNQIVRDIMCIFVAINVKLFISDSFWMYSFFWSMIGFSFLCLSRRHKKVRRIKR